MCPSLGDKYGGHYIIRFPFCATAQGDSSEIKLVDRFLLNFPKIFPTKHYFEKYNKKIGHRARKKDIMAQSYLSFARSGTNRARYFIGPRYILM